MDLFPAAAPQPAPQPVPRRASYALEDKSPAQALYRPVANGTPPAMPAAAAVLRPESLHPSLWLGHQLGRHADSAVPSGFAPLDAQLPGRGWPRRALTELLLPHPGVGEIRLLAPSLVATQKAGRLVMLFDPPARLCAGALAQLGFDVEQLLIINTRTRVIPGSDSLWALEQALKSGHVGAVLAWLPPRLRAERLRRLQLAAHAHDGPAFVLREMNAAQRPTAAPLRLGLRANGADKLAVRVFKRRGPPLAAPVQLALPPMLSDVAQQRAGAGLEVGTEIGTDVDASIGTDIDASIDLNTAPAQTGALAESATAAAASYMKAAALRAATFIDLGPG